jgi:hypothetical protein
MAQLTRKAVPNDWPGIEAVRDECFARWGMKVQERDFLEWFVSEYDGRIVAAVGYSDERDQRTVLDWYAEDTRFGKRGTSAILKLLLSASDADNMTIVGISTFPEFVEHALRREFRFLGIAVYRPPGGPKCHQQF